MNLVRYRHVPAAQKCVRPFAIGLYTLWTPSGPGLTTSARLIRSLSAAMGESKGEVTG